MNPSKYRQTVADFERRLTTLAAETQPREYINTKTGVAHTPRVLIDTTGTRTNMVPGGNDYTRMVQYGRRRYLSVCRVFMLLERLKGIESFDAPVAVSHSGAYWQSVRGTTSMPACHTCPSLLLLNGQLPIRMTSNLSWQQQIILVQADCMLMPKAINDIDAVIDSLEGREMFAQLAARLLNAANERWQDTAETYRECMRQYFGPLHQLSLTEDIRIMALQGFYEGVFLTAATSELRTFSQELDRCL